MKQMIQTILKKLSSRKFWMAIAGVTTGIATIFGADGSEISTIAGTVTAISSIIIYISTEGKVDAESLKNVVDNIKDTCDVFQKEEISG